MISPRVPVSLSVQTQVCPLSPVLSGPPEPAASHEKQDPGEGGNALRRRNGGHDAAQAKEIREDPRIQRISSQNRQNSDSLTSPPLERIWQSSPRQVQRMAVS